MAKQRDERAELAALATQADAAAAAGNDDDASVALMALWDRVRAIKSERDMFALAWAKMEFDDTVATVHDAQRRYALARAIYNAGAKAVEDRQRARSEAEAVAIEAGTAPAMPTDEELLAAALARLEG